MEPVSFESPAEDEVVSNIHIFFARVCVCVCVCVCELKFLIIECVLKFSY